MPNLPRSCVGHVSLCLCYFIMTDANQPTICVELSYLYFRCHLKESEERRSYPVVPSLVPPPAAIRIRQTEKVTSGLLGD